MAGQEGPENVHDQVRGRSREGDGLRDGLGFRNHLSRLRDPLGVKKMIARWNCHGNVICCQYIDQPTCNSAKETHRLTKWLNRKLGIYQ